MRQRALSPWRVMVLWWVAQLAAGCEAVEVVPYPTQITLQIDGEQAVKASLLQLRVSVALREGADKWRPSTRATLPAHELRWPVSVPVTPRDTSESAGQFEIVVEALGVGEVLLAETRALVFFQPGRHRVLPINLFRCPGHEQESGFRCAAVGCQGDQCKVCDERGACVGVSTFNPADLPAGPGDVVDEGAGQEAGLGPDAGGAPDAGGVADASADAEAPSRVDAFTPMADGGASDASGDATAVVGSDANVDAGRDATVATNYWCDAQTRPFDVLAADYQCLDFEMGLPEATTWLRSTTDTTRLTTSSDRALSLPLSLRTHNDAGLGWATFGTQRVTSFSFAAAVNPIEPPTSLPRPLDARLVCLTIGEFGTSSMFEQCVYYTYKGDVDGIANYTGLYLRQLTVSGSGATQVQEFPLNDATNNPLNFNSNLWNTLLIKVESSFQVTLNGKTATAVGGIGSDSRAMVNFGSNDWTVSYDNVVVSLKRGP